MAFAYLLLETGGYLLLETGGRFILEPAIQPGDLWSPPDRPVVWSPAGRPAVFGLFPRAVAWSPEPRPVAFAPPPRTVTWELVRIARGKTLMAVKPCVKTPAEVRTYRMLFGSQPELSLYGDTLTGTPTVAAVAASGSTGTVTAGTPAISGTEVQFSLTGGTDANDYTVTVTAATVGGSTLQGVGTLQVRAQP